MGHERPLSKVTSTTISGEKSARPPPSAHPLDLLHSHCKCSSAFRRRLLVQFQQDRRCAPADVCMFVPGRPQRDGVRDYPFGAPTPAPAEWESSVGTADALAACFFSSRFCCFRARRSLTACSRSILALVVCRLLTAMRRSLSSSVSVFRRDPSIAINGPADHSRRSVRHPSPLIVRRPRANPANHRSARARNAPAPSRVAVGHSTSWANCPRAGASKFFGLIKPCLAGARQNVRQLHLRSTRNLAASVNIGACV